MNYIPNDIDGGTLFIEGMGGISQEGWGGDISGSESWIDGGSAFIETWGGTREGVRD